MLWYRTFAAVVLVWCVAGPAQLGAQARLRYGGTPPADGQTLVVSIGGGVSLGAYQAGLSWGLLELYRAANSSPALAAELGVPASELATLAGTSAGNINALILALEACALEAPGPPESSLFFSMWVPVGVRQLMPDRVPRQRRDRALFDRAFFRDTLYARMREHMAQVALDPSCSVGLGTALTRLRPDTLHMGQLSVVTQRMATAVVAEVDTTGARPRLRFAWPDRGVYADPRLGRFALPPRAAPSGDVELGRVLDAVEASSAFPLVFEPVDLELVDPATGTIRVARFVDGGVFDNFPTGLALDLLVGSASFAGRLADARPDTLSLLLVSPARLRGRLAAARATLPQELAGAGLLTALQLVQGALPTARQYELQLWARDTRIRPPDVLQVRVTSRAHPVIGEHMGAFAAFLARPFREYDFFTGVYDALDFVSREYACAGSPDEDLCVATTMARLLDRPVIDFGPVAPPLLAAFFAREHASGTAGKLTVAAADPGAEPGVSLLLGLFEALQSQYVHDRSSCTMRSLPEFILCARGFREVLDAMRSSPRVRAAVDSWRQVCQVDRTSEDCLEAREFARLLDDPEKYAAATVDRLLQRLLDVEHEIHAQQRDEMRRSGTVTARLDAEAVTQLLIAMYRARPLRPRYGFVFSPGSAPADAWAVHTLLPYHIAANLGAGGVELGIRPTWYAARKAAITFPATLLAARAADPADGARRTHAYAGGGIGVAFTGVLPSAAELFLFPETGLSLQHLGRVADWERHGWVAEAYVDVSLLVGRARLALRHSSEPALFGGTAWALGVGIADFNGLVYWASRFIAHR